MSPWVPYSYGTPICTSIINVGYFLLSICFMLIWWLVQLEELRRWGESYFLTPTLWFHFLLHLPSISKSPFSPTYHEAKKTEMIKQHYKGVIENLGKRLCPHTKMTKRRVTAVVTWKRKTKKVLGWKIPIWDRKLTCHLILQFSWLNEKTASPS